ncbi:MAG: PIG-L family deacetylase [bacterium]|nr:MAG: PIG-L family deacetylase [bacterium]
MKNLLIFILYTLLIFSRLGAGEPVLLNSSEIQLALKKMKVVGSVLYIAAHPDDENTALLSYLSKEALLKTGYLSITRGDGGQNLIGNESNGILGILRTQELLAARRIDGATQFFTRAIDFGYSKSPQEALEIWGRDDILSDMVWIIRQFKPDIIITRFTPDISSHGHHRASAILAIEAFRAAADPTKFPEQLSNVDLWQPKRVVWNAWRSALEDQNLDVSKLPMVDLGTYNPLLGNSYGEISAKSRSMHKSQGFGAAPRRGSYPEYFIHLGGDVAQSDLFDGVETSWKRIPGGEAVAKLLDKALKEWIPDNPTQILPVLFDTRRKINELPPNDWKYIKLQEIDTIIRSCLGLWMEATAADYYVTAGDSVRVDFQIINRSSYTLILNQLDIPFCDLDTLIDKRLSYNIPLEFAAYLTIPATAEVTRPYWLNGNPNPGAYDINQQEFIGKPENEPALEAIFSFQVNQENIEYKIPVLYKWTDPVQGERYREVMISPPVKVSFKEKLYLFPNQNTKSVELDVTHIHSESGPGMTLEVPAGWLIQPETISLNGNASLSFNITPPRYSNTVSASLIQPNTYSKPLFQESVIDYAHIPLQALFSPAAVTLVRLDIKYPTLRVGYIMGSGDDIPPILTQLGISVIQLDEQNFASTNLSSLNSIITGIRAYNTQPWLLGAQPALLEYVKSGGTLVVQYNVSRGLVMDNIGPYPFQISRDRISDENSPVSLLKPTHPLFNFPNKIEQTDFDGWVQERGLYFAGEWDRMYDTPLAATDPGEQPKAGGILYCNYGRGIFIYSGLAFFRQLPAGVSGAYKLFVNMIAAKGSQ